MNIGSLDRRVTLLARDTAVAASGARVETWAEQAVVWAGRNDGAGQEVERPLEERAVQQTTFRLRFRADVSPAWRVRDFDGDWEVVSTSMIGRRAGLSLTCKLVGA